MFVSCPDALVPILIHELKGLGIEKPRSGFCGVFVPQTMENVYTINYCSRVATRVLWPLLEFRCQDRHKLYQEASKINWSDYQTLEQTFAIDANVSHPNLKNSLFAAQVLKDAICDHFKDKHQARPSVNVASPDVQYNLFIHSGNATISLDTSGAPLYKRGYRTEAVAAPLQESLAAALLALVRYTPKDILCDPFCGSGTFLIEAAMMSSQTPAGYFRNTWGFMHHPNYSENEWLSIKEKADAKIVPLEKGKILGADNDPQGIKLCRALIKATGFQDAIDVECTDVKSYRPLHPTLVISNPPYGKRLEVSSNTYSALGRFLKLHNTTLKRAFILTSNPELIRAIGLHTDEPVHLKNGGLDVGFYAFHQF
jgi:putative N6-adenine-specific DNA methylase